ncbi:MAG TPA: helix-hairpin-helix domain-containing protein [Allosphingosinicella sp.]
MTDRLDINSASKEEIDSVEGLNGHGHEIVHYREERGRFTSLRQLDEVPGLAGKVNEQTRKRLRVQG